MKMNKIVVIVIEILLGVVLAVFVLKDMQVSIIEAAVIFAYLALSRIGIQVIRRAKKAENSKEDPSTPPLNGAVCRLPVQTESEWRPAA